MPKKKRSWPDLNGKSFGSWTVLSKVISDLNGKRQWLCRCVCGTIKPVLSTYLLNGRSTGCAKCANKRCFMNRGCKKISSDKISEIVERYRTGESSVDLAKEYNVNPGTVLNYIKNYGCRPRTIQEHGLRNRKEPGVSAANYIYKYYKCSAKWRHLEMTIGRDDFFKLTALNCHYCGSLPSNKKTTSNGSFIYSGLDRVDSKKGYHVDNVVPCCITCNRAKSDMSTDEFMAWVNKVASYNLMQNKINIPLVLDEIP